jgi:hypothetical protein
MTMVVRDEADILAANFDYHLDQGVDRILVIDHGSTDATPEILRAYERRGVVRWWRDDARPHLQADRVARLVARVIEEPTVQWIIHGDADEFWMPSAGRLRDVFGALPHACGYIEVTRHEFLPVADTTSPFDRRLVVRHRQSHNLRGHPLESKIAQRPDAGGTISAGNHYLRDPARAAGPALGTLSVLHFPARSWEQFARKVTRNGVGHELNPAREDGVGCDQLALLELQRAGRLQAHYDALVARAERFLAGEDDPGLVRDDRLAHALGAGAARSPEAADLLGRLWSLHEEGERLRAECSQALEALARAREDAEDARAQRDRLARTLELVRASATMRYTAPARRMYYRLRGPS